MVVLKWMNLLLKKKHDVSNFKKKAEFLKGLKFTNSIATKLYEALSQNGNLHLAERYDKYYGQYKFILRPQLERVCEKYNLYVRAPEFFMGDIPSENIEDMKRFKILVEDIPFEKLFNQQNYRGNLKSWFSDKFQDVIENNSFNTYFNEESKIALENFHKCRLAGLIKVAAIKELFNDKAFNNSNARIEGVNELNPKHQVDLDPIILCETKHGYLIITAWGDEANHELVINPSNN